MTDTSGLAAALSGPAPSRLLRLGIVEAVNDTAVPPTLTVNSRMMRYVNRVPIGQAALYIDEGQDPVVLGKLSEGDDGAPVGGVIEYGGSVAPPGWLLCDGRSTSGYPKLAAVVGSTVPDLRGLFVIGAGNGYALGGTGGAATVQLSSTQNGRHSHAGVSHTHPGPTHNHGMSFHSHGFATSTISSHNHAAGHQHVFSTKYTSATTHNHFNSPGSAAEGPEGAFTSQMATHFLEMNTGQGGSHGHSGTTGSPNNNASENNSPNTTGATTSITAADPPDATQAHENRPPYYVLTRIIRAA